jgi:thiosulfate dehydrogenase
LIRFKISWLFPVSLALLFIGLMIYTKQPGNKHEYTSEEADCWTGAGINQAPVDSAGMLIRYGHSLISNTAFYLGPKGTVAHSSNGMNCQNCHLEAGTKPWGNNYGGVASTYPKFRARSGMIETIEKRINDCFERSLNGEALPGDSREMKAIMAYMQWLGNEVPKGTKPKGSGIVQLTRLSRAANPAKGKMVYTMYCERCHGSNGEGQTDPNTSGYAYPPLWGAHSYNDGAGLYRISLLAGYVKNNMPSPLNYHQTELSDENAWDVAAFINSQPRPSKDKTKDWPDISKKPFDHPFGPYADGLSETQHKYGPW